jgi:hypothetical protein
MPGKLRAEGGILDALTRLVNVGLVEQDQGGGLYRLDRTTAEQITARAAQEEYRAYVSRPVDAPVFDR